KINIEEKNHKGIDIKTLLSQNKYLKCAVNLINSNEFTSLEKSKKQSKKDDPNYKLEVDLECDEDFEDDVENGLLQEPNFN
ncbi:MAG: hypothetical protein MHPSP_004413, partial [Paramarteilia canceri]